MEIRRVLKTKKIISICLLLYLPLYAFEAMSETGLKPGHPERYVVQEGDTLWGISGKFLNDPWLWPLILEYNPGINSPHEIYPGDLLIVTSDQKIKAVQSKTTVQNTSSSQDAVSVQNTDTVQSITASQNIRTIKLTPQTHIESLHQAIPALPPHIINPFLSSAMIIQPGDLDQLGYVLSGVEDELIMGKYTRFYARGLGNDSAVEYQLFRADDPIRDPDSNELLGIEAIHIGNARMDRRGKDISKLVLIDTSQEARPGDRLLPVTEELPLPYYQPHAPSSPISGTIMHAPLGVLEVGKYDIIIITGGSEEGVEPGHVLKVLDHREPRIDSVTGENYQVPDEESGLIMVFSVYDKLSYALVMESSSAIAIGDKFISP